MKKDSIILANFDARISDIDIKPKNSFTKVIITSKMYDELSKRKKPLKSSFRMLLLLILE